MRKILAGIVGLTFVISGSVFCKEKDQKLFPVSSISPDLKKDAFAVCRLSTHEFELLSYGKAVEKVHLVITVLEENGNEYSRLYLPYDKTTKIRSISGKSYNEAGLPDDKLKNNTILDLNYNSAGAIFDDIRLKSAEIKPESYPYTIEYKYEIEYDGLISYPEWRPIEDYRLSVEHSSFKFTRPQNLEIRYRELKVPEGCRTERNENGKLILEWKLDSIEAFRDEAMSPELYTQTPRVICGPTNFTYNDSSGKMSSWKDLGIWINGLNKGLDQLPDSRKTEIRNLVGEVKDTATTVQSLYKYMQKRTRYVGIQLGLGGYQPFPAETVDRLGYGDCKALSNYMKALLNAVNIPSIYVIAGAGSNKGVTMDDFPTISQTNHAVLCVPMKKDSIWLECTDQKNPCGYMGTFTCGHRVILISPDGGKLVTIPKLSLIQNSQNCVAELKINQDGVMSGTAKTSYSGYEYENISGELTESPKEQEKVILKRLGIAGLVINKFSNTEKKDQIPEVTQMLDFSSAMSVSKTGVRLFVPLNLLSQHLEVPTKVDDRKFPFVQRFASIEKDSVTYMLPEGYQTETIPKEKLIKTEFGEYHVRFIPANDRIIYLRELKIFEGNWPKEKYQSLIGFYTSVVNSDKSKLVLKQK
jgi:hypothetical protein